jgi:hypothetical protein
MAFESLKKALLGLDAAGEKGFEGLTKLALSKVTGLRFRLAESGPQGGIDGEDANIGFECKLYTSKLPQNAVKTKIAELAQRKDIDLWVLCTTVMVRARLFRELQEQGAQFGLEVQLVDWDDAAGAPRLAVLMALVDADRLDAFLAAAGVAASDGAAVRAELDAFRASGEFADEVVAMAARFDVAHLGFEAARRANQLWLRNVLGDRQRARYALGQPMGLTAADSADARICRPTLVTQLTDHMLAVEAGSILVLLGEEGVGKSWAPLDAWLRMDDPPMLLFVPAGKLAELGASADVLTVLETFLPSQLEHRGLAHDQQRWHRTLTRWLQGSRRLPLVLVVDGINQHAGTDWGTTIGRLNHDLKATSARVIVSSRPGFFETRVKPRLAEPTLRVVVPEWTETERDSILREAGRDPAELAPQVGESLRNPRLLAIALTLLGENTLRDLREVSIPYLIFRHLDIMAMDSPSPVDVHAVRDRLKRHARELAEATTDEQKQALATIDDLDAAKEGRFLRIVDDDTVRFELGNEGLTLAMGLALFDRVQDALRQGRDVGEELARIIEPIAAPDMTVDIVLAAALVADGRANDDGEAAMAALLVAFVGLQNVSDERLAGFMALCRKWPRPFLRATEQVWLEPVRKPDGTWLELALVQLRTHEDGWRVATGEIRRWLRYYSREHRPFNRHESQASLDERNAEYAARIAARIATLTATEQAIVSRLVDSQANISALFDLAFRLMAGQPIAPFVPALADWAFGHQLNPVPYTPVFEFDWLGQYNTVDWEQMRDAVRALLEALPDASLSRTGLAAKVRLLVFSGDSDDAMRATEIQRHLNETNPDWRNPTYPTRADPLDPSSIVPRNADVEEKQAGLDVAKLHTSRGTTVDDHLRQRSLPALVRSRPALAVAKSRELLAHVRTRSGLALRQGLFSLGELALLLTPEDARAFIAFRRERFAFASAAIEESERALLSWYLLQVSFPHLSGDEQLTAMTDPAADTSVAVQLLPSLKAPSERHAAAVIDKVLSMGARERRLVAGVLSESDVVPSNLGALIDALGDGEDALYALLLLAAHGDDARLSDFVRSGWSASDQDSDSIAFFGSRVLLEAANKGLTTAAAIADRVSIEAWGELAQGTQGGARAVAHFLTDLIERIVGIDVVQPVIDIELQDRPDHWPRRLPDISRQRRDEDDADEFPGEFGQEVRDYQARAAEDHRELLRIEEELANKKALPVLRSLFPGDMAAIAKAAPDVMQGWVPQLLRVSPKHQPLAYTLALLVAGELADSDPASAIALVDHYRHAQPFSNVVVGWARYPLLVKTVWTGQNPEAWKSARTQRLRAADNDHALFIESMAAGAEGNAGAFLGIVDGFLASAMPSLQARGLTLLGFMDESEETRSRLQQWEDAYGMPGAAYDHAIGAWEKNAWARHWLSIMVSAETDEEAWCAQVLFLECVDARFEHWSPAIVTGAPGAWRFDGNIENAIRNKLERHKRERSKRLFGTARPRDEFLVSGR